MGGAGVSSLFASQDDMLTQAPLNVLRAWVAGLTPSIPGIDLAAVEV